MDPRTRGEAITHLEQAAETLPSARATLEKVRARALDVDFAHDVLVHEAPDPTLARLNGPGQGMLGAVKMFGRVLVLRGVAAAHVAAFHTEAQVHPRIAALEALLAAAPVRGA